MRTGQEGRTVVGHSTMKLANQLAILRVVREGGPITRVMVQRETGLSWGTVTSLIRELVQKKIIVEVGPVHTVAGRRPVELDLNRQRNYIAGIRLGGANVRSVLMDLKGSIIASVRLEVDSQGTRQSLLGKMFQSLEMAMGEVPIKKAMLTGIGIAVPGAVDVQSGTSLYAPHHPHWKCVPVRDIFQKRYGVPCFIDHVNNCSVMGEKWFGHAQGVDDFLCVLLGTGVSVGIMIGGEVYRGVDSAAGELGHVVIDPAGPVCACGKRGCLEAFTSGSALSRVGETLARGKRSSRILALAGGDPRRITARTLFEVAVAGDEDARRAFAEMGRVLGRGLAMLINLFNPSRVILCGQLSRAQEFFLPAAMASVNEYAWSFSHKEIVVSATEDPAILGAAAIVLNQVLSTGLLVRKE